MNNKVLKVAALVLGVAVVFVGVVIVVKPMFNKSSKAVLQDPKTYTDLSNGFSIERPADWASTSPQPGATSFAHESGSNVTVVVEQLASEDVTLKEYTETALAGLEQLELNLTLIDSYDSKTAGQSSYTIEYTIQSETLTVRAKGVWFLKGGKAYVFTFTAPQDLYETFEPTGMAIIESVKVK